jgi:NADH-quinone oxidoreductase subunit H
MDWMYLLMLLVKAVIVVLIVMTVAGYSVVGERKVAAWAQVRPGPNRTTMPIIAAIPFFGRILQRWGIIQLPADGAKFLVKEEPIPGHVNKLYYNLAPIVAFVPAMVVLTVIPFGQYSSGGSVGPVALSSMDVGMLFVMAISGLSVFGIIMGGWAANSKFPYFGCIRASAQLISYELVIGLALLPVFMWTGGSLDLFAVVQQQGGVLGGGSFGLPKWFIFFMPFSALMYLVAIFAEANRLPFDMPESETDLVGGYHTEYGAFKFGLFYVGEYAHMTVGALLFSILFLGGWSFPFLSIDLYTGWLGAFLSICVLGFKALFILFLFMWVRWTLPRFRYDQVMNLSWKILLPLGILNLGVYAIVMALMA